MPEKTARKLDEEIERTRREIADLQKRIRDGAIRREAGERTPSRRKDYPRISQIDAEIERALEMLKSHPDNAARIQIKIAELQTERYRLLLTLDE